MNDAPNKRPVATTPRWRPLLVFVGALALALPVTEARPCSLAAAPAPASLPPDRATLGPQPLLIASLDTEPLLWRDGAPEAPIPVVVDEAFGDFFVGRTAAIAYRPASPLPEGQYWWMGHSPYGGTSNALFWVDPAAVEQTPTLTGGALALHLDEPDESGCDGGSSCDGIDFTRMQIRFSSEAEAFVLTVDNPRTGATRAELVSGRDDWAAEPLVQLWNDPDRFPGSFKRDVLCVTLTPISEGGAIGEVADLGCIDPDAKDPRVTDTRGCTVGASGPESLALWLALLLLARFIPRRRHAPSSSIDSGPWSGGF